MKYLKKVLFIFAIFTILFSKQTYAAILSPPFSDIVYERGKSYDGSFTVYFREGDPDTLYLSKTKLKILDDGKKKVVDSGSGDNTLANWMSLKKSKVTRSEADKGNGVKVSYTVDVPNDAAPGGHYAGVIVSAKPNEENAGEEESKVSIGSDLVYQLLANIEGDQVNKTKLIDFRTKDNQKFFSHLPVYFETTFESNGNIHVVPVGNIEMYKGERKAGTVAFNKTELRIFPGKKRTFEDVWAEEMAVPEGAEENAPKELPENWKDELPETFWEHCLYELNNFKFGKYEARLGGFSGNQPAFQMSTSFWIIPWHILLVVLAVVFVILTLLVYKTKGRNKKS